MKEILQIATTLSNEKNVPLEVIYQAVEDALALATQRYYYKYQYTDRQVSKATSTPVDIDIAIDRTTGTYETFRRWLVVADDDEIEEGIHLTTAEAHEKDAGLCVGDVYREKVDNIPFGRTETQLARQVLVQKINEAEQAKIIAEYAQRQGKLLSGIVQRVTRNHLIVDLGDTEAFLPRSELIGNEIFRVGNRIRAVLQMSEQEDRHPQLLLSRICNEMVSEMFTIEVPEIAEQTIQIRGVARDPGYRTKIAVKTNDGRLDPVGACIGMRGSRVQAISNELASERIDIILWDENPVQFVINALTPAEVDSIVLNEETHSMDVIIAEDNLPTAIGRNGQNVKLAIDLTGWTIRLMGKDEAQEKKDVALNVARDKLVEYLQIEQPIAQLLVNNDIRSIEEMLYIPLDDITAIEGIDRQLAEELRSKAEDALLRLEFSGEEQPADDLLTMEGMSMDVAHKLAAQGVVTRADLADQAIGDMDLTQLDLDEAQLGQLIMTARKIWNEEQPA